jgi:signal transduction histidine kinase
MKLLNILSRLKKTIYILFFMAFIVNVVVKTVDVSIPLYNDVAIVLSVLLFGAELSYQNKWFDIKWSIFILLVLCVVYTFVVPTDNLITWSYFIALDHILSLECEKQRRILSLLHFIAFLVAILCSEIIVDGTNQIVNTIISFLQLYFCVGILIAFICMYKKDKEKMLEANLNLIQCSFNEAERKISNEKVVISQSLHDSLGNQLVAILMNIRLLKRKESNLEKIAELEYVEELAKAATKTLKDSVENIRQSRNSFDFEKELNNLIFKFDRLNIIKIEYISSRVENCICEKYKILIFQIIQEAITNAVYHGKATRIKIIIDKRQEKLTCYIKDNGIGCRSIEKSYGLNGMVESVKKQNGTITFNSELNKGFEIKAIL